MVIRFVQPWRGREPGDINTSLDHGVAVELIRRNIAVEHCQVVASSPPPQQPRPAATTYRKK